MPREQTVFLLDVDNTLLDNDRIIAELRECLTRELGEARQQRYWAIFEEYRAQLGYADYLGTLQRFRLEDPGDPHLVAISAFLLDYPFAERLFPDALAVIAHLDSWGTTVVLTDGDVVFQPLKISRAGISAAVQGRVLIYVHKEQSLEDVERRYPADHYVVVDDKVRLLTAIQQVWGERVTTVFPRQGHYAREEITGYPSPDVTLERIGELLHQSPPPGVSSSSG